jgi:hypothetical protein
VPAREERAQVRGREDEATVDELHERIVAARAACSYDSRARASCWT